MNLPRDSASVEMKITELPDMRKISSDDVVRKILGYLVYPQPYLDNNKSRVEIENRSRKILLGTEDDEFEDKHIIEWYGYKDREGAWVIMRIRSGLTVTRCQFKYKGSGDGYVEF